MALSSRLRVTTLPSSQSSSNSPSSVISHPQIATRYASNLGSVQYCRTGIFVSEYPAFES